MKKRYRTACACWYHKKRHLRCPPNCLNRKNPYIPLKKDVIETNSDSAPSSPPPPKKFYINSISYVPTVNKIPISDSPPSSPLLSLDIKEASSRTNIIDHSMTNEEFLNLTRKFLFFEENVMTNKPVNKF